MIGAEIFTLSLPYLDKGRKRVRVYVPTHEDGERFPVVYMTDGQNLFEDDSVEFGCWYTREAVEAERERCGKAAIIVGIHNDESPLQRTNELTPGSIGALAFPPDMPKEMIRLLVPEGELFDCFVTDTVMPAVEERFPVKTGRENTAFCGSSSGGLQTFYTALSHPDLFGAAGVFSPCLMLYHPNELKEWIREKIKKDMPMLYIYSGGADELERAILMSVNVTCGFLGELYPAGRFKTVILTDNPHHESAWAPIFRDFLSDFLKN